MTSGTFFTSVYSLLPFLPTSEGRGRCSLGRFFPFYFPSLALRVDSSTPMQGMPVQK